MPRLSIIIPHRNDDARLEATVLSVLENRPQDSEIIVVHNGTYADPYDLADELLVVEGEPRSNCLQLLNTAVMAACAPVVCTLLDGLVVSNDWAEEPLEIMGAARDTVVSVATRVGNSSQVTYGISTRAIRSGSELQRGKVELEKATGPCCGPQLSCGFYPKRLLRSLGGWNERLDISVADIDLAWTLQALGLPVTCATTSEVVMDAKCARNFSNASMKQLAELAVGYEVTAGGATHAMGDLLRGCLAGNVSLSVAWASGIMSGRATESVKQRIALAKEQWSAEPQLQFKRYQSEGLAVPQRRAA